MAQSNVAREPSMDEILASIRKIIESNEAIGPGFPANDPGSLTDHGFRSDRPYLDDHASDDIHLTIDDDVLVAAFEAEESRTRPDQVPFSYASEPSRAPPPLSLADVAARVRAASERQSLPPRPAAQEQAMAATREPAVIRGAPQELPVARVISSTEPLQTEIRTPAPVRDMPPALRDTLPIQPPHAPPLRAVAEAPERAEAEPSPAAPAMEPAPAPPAAQAPERPAEKQPEAVPQPEPATEREASAILSDAVSEQVARSFGELTLALDNSARRSFDEIAEDMLRPMLQEWLDDNLPTLVERLVREEIERVARGPRR